MQEKSDNLAILIAIAFFVLDVFLWFEIFFAAPVHNPELYFLDVGQGDSELLLLPGNVKILTDAGPDKAVVPSLESALRPGDRYIDLAVISHPQLDHFNGFHDLLGRYEFGAFLMNGRSDSPGVEEWPALVRKIQGESIPIMTLGAGDTIRYLENRIDILSPSPEWLGSGELNDTGIVERIETRGWSALLTADIGINLEAELRGNYDMRAHILKVGHHGSKYSSSEAFLKDVDPKLAVIGVGRNRYGHPTRETLMRLMDSGAKVLRTDRNGTVRVVEEEGKLKIFAEK